MNGLYGIWCKLCALFDVIGKICTKVDMVVENNETICNKIEEIVGDPDAPCPDCPAETAEAPLVQEAVASTVAAQETTARVKESAAALKAQFAKSVKKTAEKTAE